MTATMSVAPPIETDRPIESRSGPTSPEAPPSIRRASLLLTAATLVASGVNYLLNLLLARWMTPSEFGDANLIVTVMLGLTAVAVALQLLAARRISTTDTAGADVHRRRLLRRAWAVGVAVAAVMTIASPFLQRMTSSASAVPFVLLAVGLPCYLAQAVERGVLQGQLRFGSLSATLVVEAVTRIGIAIGLVAAGFGVIGATAGITASFVASWWCGRTCVVDRSAESARTDPTTDPTPPMHHAASTSGSESTERLATQATMLLLVGQIVINNGDVVLAKSLFDADTAGVYSVVALIGRAVFFLSWSVVTAAFPHVSRGDGDVVQRQAVRTVAVMCAAMTIAVSVAAPPLTPIVFGDDYSSAAPLFAPYAIATSLFAVANVYATLGVARGRRASAAIIVAGGIGQTALLLALAGSSTEMVWLQVLAMGLLLAMSWRSSRRASRSTIRVVANR
jgi:O-antigen/teichoic acid export membrane protein